MGKKSWAGPQHLEMGVMPGTVSRKTNKRIEMKRPAERIVSFYLDGFRRMQLGRRLWVIILIKLLIIFGVLKVFFFPDYLQENFNNDMERADHVLTNLTKISTEK
jgi:hypothetical protein